jgi:hypothetical protein
MKLRNIVKQGGAAATRGARTAMSASSQLRNIRADEAVRTPMHRRRCRSFAALQTASLLFCAFCAFSRLPERPNPK